MSKRCPICKRPPNDVTLTPGHAACECPKPSETEGVREWRVTQDTDNDESLNWIAGEYVLKSAYDKQVKLTDQFHEWWQIASTELSGMTKANGQFGKQIDTLAKEVNCLIDQLFSARREVEDIKAQHKRDIHGWQTTSIEIGQERAKSKELLSALEQIADPRKRDHKEPDAYTTLGCVMHIAEQAIEKHNSGKGG